MEFKVVKKGYDIKSVEEYISNLTHDYEERLSLQKDRIFALKDELEKSNERQSSDLFSSLLSSIERAKQIESSARKILELETKRLSLTYLRIESIILNSSDPSSIKDDLLSTLRNSKKMLEDSLHNTNLNDINIQDKLKSFIDNYSADLEFASLDKGSPTSVSDIDNASQVYEQDPTTTVGNNINLVQVSPHNNLVKDKKKSKKLNNLKSPTQNEVEIKLTRQELDSTGFDLREAVNPKEDLDEIMKAFDFYNDNKKSSKY